MINEFIKLLKLIKFLTFKSMMNLSLIEHKEKDSKFE